eukprot:TRINITY_DN1747_c0_g1_i1.p1 TRINITY_DN1747_c0_g1~~TRINITY_DN1747_c0_g1_i1.p1  ORF type:complete len:154 (+),score=44.49 TRINITY_DN1747_c0_g1_i1:59-520(+)
MSLLQSFRFVLRISNATLHTSSFTRLAVTPSVFVAQQDKEKYYRLLVDTYRLKMDEDYKFGGKAKGLYAWVSSTKKDPSDENYPVNHFATFLQSLKEHNQLPMWWNDMEDSKMKDFAKDILFYTLEKSDLLDSNGHETQRLTELKQFLKNVEH